MIQVFCDVHSVLMEVFASQSDRWPFSVFRCAVWDCSRHFVEPHGYHNVTDQRLDTTTQVIKDCPAHAGAVAITYIEGSMLFWNCIHPDCEAYEPTFETTPE
jgi:hypothetical protein